MRFTLIISLVLAILAVVFALQNPGSTDVNVLGFSYAGSKALILIITFAVGVVVGVLATIPAYFRNRRKVSSLQKTIAEERTETRREEPSRSAGAQQPPREQRETAPPADDASTTASSSDDSPTR